MRNYILPIAIATAVAVPSGAALAWHGIGAAPEHTAVSVAVGAPSAAPVAEATAGVRVLCGSIIDDWFVDCATGIRLDYHKHGLYPTGGSEPIACLASEDSAEPIDCATGRPLQFRNGDWWSE